MGASYGAQVQLTDSFRAAPGCAWGASPSPLRSAGGAGGALVVQPWPVFARLDRALTSSLPTFASVTLNSLSFPRWATLAFAFGISHMFSLPAAPLLALFCPLERTENEFPAYSQSSLPTSIGIFIGFPKLRMCLSGLCFACHTDFHSI